MPSDNNPSFLKDNWGKIVIAIIAIGVLSGFAPTGSKKANFIALAIFGGVSGYFISDWMVQSQIIRVSKLDTYFLRTAERTRINIIGVLIGAVIAMGIWYLKTEKIFGKAAASSPS